MTSNVMPFRNVKHASMLWASPERAEEIAGLHAKLFDPAWDAAAIKSLLEHPAATSLIAVAGSPKAIIGFIIGQLAADEAEILSIGVAPNWQRAGLAMGLLEGLARAARRGEAKRIFLEVAEDNEAALALYRKLGFEEVGRRKRYYVRPGNAAVDALTMALTL
ncbi:ribosomal-protein-alanine N-acetyltransferase [Hyphomicrobium methylovorum]|uniref:ribosomal protein S18-alanine N-acetyltransferase n=1 Tax=Hyphomicrobium methylovorum TaxID=84 RepID=UPI0015E77F60|nr:ribosomal protein S18-alanine N-acetyltransferase [Hyphomicrobium methylovorum]MBA2126371.1 ribosomal-protein-alanine N-acetyltransferase [Hyphomicrobium methylovorum]